MALIVEAEQAVVIEERGVGVGHRCHGRSLGTMGSQLDAREVNGQADAVRHLPGRRTLGAPRHAIARLDQAPVDEDVLLVAQSHPGVDHEAAPSGNPSAP
jgi:hypothetical protein